MRTAQEIKDELEDTEASIRYFTCKLQAAYRTRHGLLAEQGRLTGKTPEQGRKAKMDETHAFPDSVEYEGRTYYRTNKYGRRRANGAKAAEYATSGHVWLDGSNGEIYLD